MNLRQCYLEAGADYEESLHRFMSEERMIKFLKMFLKDQSYAELCGAIEADDLETAFRAVHTMKGVCMNLSLTSLQEKCHELTEYLRAGTDNEDMKACFAELQERYLRTTLAIRNYIE